MVEIVIIAALVIWSAVYTFNKVFPKSAFKVFNALANVLEQQKLHKLASWVRPAMVTGCGGGCGCSSAEKPAKVTETTKAVKWK
ncbi:DUF6587 family protein [Acinetobacter rathckeae]|uniref:DUF6587 family protein n=1 Tax=Acinetobacter rathckeae TaxID=2605272 RepID=UPI0018A264B4|nr:DUF6587 family protein [Acinetobacter rathckeae]MBF7688338.1 hypothetical protein [Acinetobacter rathckeae]MBF7695143.1 hypothetical protein [Acinetobacter rathckeae]